MEYQTLYRKYRPKTFDEVYGQEIVVKTLKNTIKNNKLTHAYLFIGPRGTGKTSVAKIFAKTINCENSKNGISCEKCDICINNNNNENIDIIEMDAASNNGVDEIREIKNHVTLLPTISKYKIYIIDEVHMLTTGAFNALLKTLEEPPEHVIFILTTTEPHKIPLTIISRCQSFEFKPITKTSMIERLKYICEKEKIKYEEEALELISIDSNGGMRDAIGLLDQLNAYTDSNITKESVMLLNGRISEEEIEKLFDDIINNNIKECFDFSEKLESDGKNFTYICDDIIRNLRNNIIDYQMNNNNEIIKKLGIKNSINIIMLVNDCINNMKNTKDKKIFFDLLLISLIQIYNQTNVCKKEDDKKSLEIVNKHETKEEKIKGSLKKDYSLYEKLMLIRLNNIISEADKISLNKYKKLFDDLENNLTNLDELKIINLLEYCKICAGSENGIIITIDNNNLLEELYENYIKIEEIIKNRLNTDVYVCILIEEKWQEERPIFVEKIKNKEKIEIISEKEILNKINSLYNNNEEKNEFEDLIEIGGE